MFGDIAKVVFGDKGLVGGVTDILKDAGILKDPKAELKVMELLKGVEVKLEVESTKRIEAVNETMRAESKSEHWMQYSWRPTIGFTFAFTIINNYIIFPYAQSLAKAFDITMQAVVIPANVWIAMLTILGAAAYTRGKEKEAKASKK